MPTGFRFNYSLNAGVEEEVEERFGEGFGEEDYGVKVRVNCKKKK